MKVRQLIEILQNHDQDAIVCIQDSILNDDLVFNYDEVLDLRAEKNAPYFDKIGDMKKGKVIILL